MKQSSFENDIKGKIVLITGSSRGIGRAIAIELAKFGYTIVIHYNVKLDDAKIVQSMVNNYGNQSMIVQADVSMSNDVKKMIKTIEKKFGSIDILVNNAAIAESKDIENITEQDWDRTINTNLKSVFFGNSRGHSWYEIKELGQNY